MRPLDLEADLLGAAIRARPPEPPKPVWIHVEIPAAQGRPAVNRWCVVREADQIPSGKRPAFIGTLCCAELAYVPVHLTTRRPHNTCPACEIELAAHTPGAGVAIEPAPAVLEIDVAELAEDEITKPRTPTVDLRPLRRRVDPPTVWDGAAPGSDSAFDPLNDLRIPEEPC